MGFTFKQFAIDDHRCAQKVGTDGVLLGCWAPITGRRILDIGCGSGLISLMLAQRFEEATITGIDIEPECVQQAQENAALSPWSNRLSFVAHDVLSWEPTQTFDAIVSNPPFFDRVEKSVASAREIARSAMRLSLERLAKKSAQILATRGTLSVVLPYEKAGDFIFMCQKGNLNLATRCNIKTVEYKPFKRVLLHFVKGDTPPYMEQTLLLLDENGQRTEEHAMLTHEFYLH